MKIVIEGTWKNDFPGAVAHDQKFLDALAEAVRKRLELRTYDTVELKIQ